jgi:hypothetical protein
MSNIYLYYLWVGSFYKYEQMKNLINGTGRLIY